MHAAYYTPLPNGLPSPKQHKVLMQRQYREKEGECFSTLREVIKNLTGEELQTRQEILRKATDLLSAVSQIRRQEEEAQAVPSMQNQPFYSANAVQSSWLVQSPHGLWHLPNTEFSPGPSASYFPDSVNVSGIAYPFMNQVHDGTLSFHPDYGNGW